MKKLLIGLLVSSFILFSSISYGAGTCAAPSVSNYNMNNVKYSVYTYSWTSDGSGDADCTAVTLSGWLLGVETDPGATAPTADYDIQLLRNGADVMGGALIDRHTSSTEYAAPLVSSVPYPMILTSESITPDVTNAGASKVGSFKIYIQK